MGKEGGKFRLAARSRGSEMASERLSQPGTKMGLSGLHQHAPLIPMLRKRRKHIGLWLLESHRDSQSANGLCKKNVELER